MPFFSRRQGIDNRIMERANDWKPRQEIHGEEQQNRNRFVDSKNRHSFQNKLFLVKKKGQQGGTIAKDQGRGTTARELGIG